MPDGDRPHAGTRPHPEVATVDQLVECVPNISEGRDRAVIDAVVAAADVEGVRLLDVAPGADTNRTVITLLGPPDAVAEAAFRLVRRAGELSDRRRPRGAHPLPPPGGPRFGARVRSVQPAIAGLPSAGLVHSATERLTRKQTNSVAEGVSPLPGASTRRRKGWPGNRRTRSRKGFAPAGSAAILGGARDGATVPQGLPAWTPSP